MNDIHAGRPDHSCLFEIASEQLGYFTAAQARDCGFNWDLLSHHARSGRFLRVRRGLYRFRDYPSSPREEVMIAWLAVGKDVATVSHESALDLLDLSDVVPAAVHLTVPRSRRSASSPLNTVVHTTTRALRPEDTIIHEGIRLTSATRSILDAADVGSAPEQIEMAIAQALERGLTTAGQLSRDLELRSRRVSQLVTNAIELVKS